MALYEFEKYLVAHAALVILTAWIPSIILFFCALCLCRRRNDPVRTAFTWLKFAFFVFADFCFFDACSYALLLAYNRIQNGDYDLYDAYTVLRSINVAQGVTGGLSLFFDMIVDILVMIMLLRIATGITIAQTGKVDPLGNITRLASYGIAALLAILTVASFALRMRYIGGYYEDYGYLVGDNLEDFWIKGRQISFSFRVLIFVVSLGVVARSIMVKLQPKSEKTLSWCSNLLIAASIVWLTRTIYNMATIAAWFELDKIYYKTFENYYGILDVVFAIWTQFVVLCLAFAIGTAKSNGLWSTHQPFMTTTGTQQTPWGYGAGPAAPTAPPMVHQQPQQYQQPQQFQQQPQFQQPYQQQQPAMQQGWHPQQQQQNGYFPPVQQSQYQQPYQQQYNPQQQPPASSISPVSQTRSPPPHEEALGFNHQANGSPPQSTPQHYVEKA